MKRTLRSSKSHGGCATCKARRVWQFRTENSRFLEAAPSLIPYQTKCDETKPSCLICRANGVDCPGYQKRIKWSTKHERFHPQAAPQAAAPQTRQDDVGSEIATDGPTSRQAVTALGQSSTSQHSNETHASTRQLPANQHGQMDVLSQGYTTEWEHYGLSAFPFTTNQTPFWLQQSPEENNFAISSGASDTAAATLGQGSGQPCVHHGVSSSSEGQENEPAAQVAGGSSSKRFLQTYYRMSQPGQVSGLTDEDFVNYYFNNVCTVYSCFDSPQNKFRSLVADAWTSSATVYLAIQSMAAGHLANHYPSLATLGLQKRSQAWRYLQKDLQLHRVAKIPTETVLLSLLLLGPSSSWHQVSNPGMQFLFIARNLMQTYLRDSHGRSNVPELQDEDFYHEALLRWEMVASFVDPVPFAALAGNMQLPQQRTLSSHERILPHPWTGVAPEIHFAVAEVGRMLRRRRTHAASMPDTPQTGSSAYVSATDDQWVEALEDFLHAVELPGVDDIANYEDVRTPSIDLIITADAMRFAGLLELYDTFPNLLDRHARDETELSGFSFAADADESSHANILASMAMHMIETVKTISITSAACRFLPFILVVASARLNVAGGASDQEQEEITTTRYTVEARMLLLSRKYPQKPMLQMLDIIKEVWQRLDQGSAETHWLDVADEKGWQTLAV